MQGMFILSAQAEPRTFKATKDGQETTVKVIDLTLTNGIDTLLASAFDQQAQRLIDNPVALGSTLMCDISLSIKTTKEEKAFQSVRLSNFAVLYGGKQ